ERAAQAAFEEDGAVAVALGGLAVGGEHGTGDVLPAELGEPGDGGLLDDGLEAAHSSPFRFGPRGRCFSMAFVSRIAASKSTSTGSGSARRAARQDANAASAWSLAASALMLPAWVSTSRSASRRKSSSFAIQA